MNPLLVAAGALVGLSVFSKIANGSWNPLVMFLGGGGPAPGSITPIAPQPLPVPPPQDAENGDDMGVSFTYRPQLTSNVVPSVGDRVIVSYDEAAAIRKYLPGSSLTALGGGGPDWPVLYVDAASGIIVTQIPPDQGVAIPAPGAINAPPVVIYGPGTKVYARPRFLGD